MRKTLFHIASLVIVASVLLAACATPTPQVVVQTAAPVVQTQVVVQTAAPVVQTQVVVQTAAPVVQTQVVEVTAAAPTLVPPTPTLTPYPVAKVAAGKVPIYWYIGLGTGTNEVQLPIEQAVVDAFNADPARATDNIQLIMQVVPNASARDALATMIAASNGPDIVGPVGFVGSNTFAGQWLDLTPYIKADNYDLGQFDAALVKMYQSEKEGTVGLPFAVFPSAIFYTAKLFDEAGLSYPPAKYGDKYKMPDGSMVDWTWDTVAQVGKLLTIDSAGKNSTEAGFDKTKIVQYGFSWQWEGTANYVGSFWGAGSMLAPGGSKGNYKAQIPDVWKAAWQWTYNGVWGDQPFIMNGQVAGSADFGSGNNFASGKVAMADQPLWYTCCIDAKTNNTWDFGAMPTYNGKVGGRVDADTFRVWKGTQHPKEAWTVLKYLVSAPAVSLLVVGTKDKASAYGAFPGLKSAQGDYVAMKQGQFPWVKNWQTVLDGLAYPDVPSAEAWVPNLNAFWDRTTTFYSLMVNTKDLDLNKEIETFRADSEVLFNK